MEKRYISLDTWIHPFKQIYETVNIALALIRDSVAPEEKCAERGFYQQNLEADQPYQMVRIYLPAEVAHFPEISAGKHRFTVRFLSQSDPQIRPSQMQDSIDFRLACCAL